MKRLIVKRLIVILFVISLPFTNYAQVLGLNGTGTLSSPLGSSLAPVDFSSLSPVHFNLISGMNFGTLGSKAGYLQSYLSPSFSMPLNKKLTITGGITYSYTNFSNAPVMNTSGEVKSYSGGMSTLTMFTSGTYRVNDKLTFSGSAFKTINPAFNTRLNPDNIQMEAQGVGFGVGYQLGENTYIGAEIRYQQGNSNLYNPNYLSPFNSIESPFRY